MLEFSPRITGSVVIDGDLTVSNGVSGVQSASYAETASFAQTASYAVSASHEITLEVSSSYAESASFAHTASFALNADGSGFPFSGSAEISGSFTSNTGTFTEALKIPFGTTEQREDTPEQGHLRYNTSTNRLEFYNGSIWITFNSNDAFLEADTVELSVTANDGVASDGGSNPTRSGGSGTAGQGFDGGDSLNQDDTGAGGGGAAQSGENAQSGGRAYGGDGVTSSITGTATARAGGGGGGPRSGTNLGGTGGGGNGSASFSLVTAGGVNTGGGGGGGYDVGSKGGGSGVVILRYPSSRTITIGAGLTGSETTVGANKVATITAGTDTISFS